MSILTLLSLTVIKGFTRCKGLRLVVNPPGLQHGVPVHSYFLRMYTSGSLLKVRLLSLMLASLTCVSIPFLVLRVNSYQTPVQLLESVPETINVSLPLKPVN